MSLSELKTISISSFFGLGNCNSRDLLNFGVDKFSGAALSAGGDGEHDDDDSNFSLLEEHSVNRSGDKLPEKLLYTL